MASGGRRGFFGLCTPKISAVARKAPTYRAPFRKQNLCKIIDLGGGAEGIRTSDPLLVEFSIGPGRGTSQNRLSIANVAPDALAKLEGSMRSKRNG
jgi:hypothetical protein